MSDIFAFPLCAMLTVATPRNNFSFKCHRRDNVPNSKDQALVFSVNDISFHPVHGTFSTCGSQTLSVATLRLIAHVGSDGTIHFWDKDARTRLKCKCMPDSPV